MNERVKQYVYANTENIGIAELEPENGCNIAILRAVNENDLKEVMISYYEDEIAHETRSFDLEAVEINKTRSDEIWYYLIESHELFIMNTAKTKEFFGKQKMVSFEFFNKHPDVRKEIGISKKDLS